MAQGSSSASFADDERANRASQDNTTAKQRLDHANGQRVQIIQATPRTPLDQDGHEGQLRVCG